MGADAGCNLAWYGMVGLLAVTLYVPILNYRVYQTVRFIARLVMLMDLRIVCIGTPDIGLRYALACACACGHASVIYADSPTVTMAYFSTC